MGDVMIWNGRSVDDWRVCKFRAIAERPNDEIARRDFDVTWFNGEPTRVETQEAKERETNTL